jgi:DNA-binding MarR family transcriptional regulator
MRIDCCACVFPLDSLGLLCSYREQLEFHEHEPPAVNVEAQRDLQLLTEVEKDTRITQRSLAKSLGVALGLTNLYLKRLARKRYIRTSVVPGRRISYQLTSRGLAEKTRLTRLSLQHSLTHYRGMRQRLRQLLLEASNRGAKRIVICGTGELAEVAYLTVLEMGLTLVGFVGNGEERTFLPHPLGAADTLLNWEFDAVVIADLSLAKTIQAQLLAFGVPADKVVTV